MSVSDETPTLELPIVHVPRFRNLADERTTLRVPAVDLLASTLKHPAVRRGVASQTPTMMRPPASTFCFACGHPLPPWRASCLDHDDRLGRGLPRPVRLVSFPYAPEERPTAPYPIPNGPRAA